MQYLTLNDGHRIPQVGLGVFQIPEGKETVDACLEAFQCGYRHIDTAHLYENERSVGYAIDKSGINREDLFITSKIWPSEYGKTLTPKAIDKMLERLNLEYLDLLLLHQQFGDYQEAYLAMEQAVKVGKVKSIGLSNFDSERLEEIYELSSIKPAILQVECHPYYPQHALKERIKPYQTILESWFPLGHGDKNLLNEPVIVELAKKYHKSTAQILLRWQIEQGNVVIPKSTNPSHIKDNIDIFDFQLDHNDLQQIAQLNKGQRYYPATTVEEQIERLGWRIPKD